LAREGDVEAARREDRQFTRRVEARRQEVEVAGGEEHTRRAFQAGRNDCSEEASRPQGRQGCRTPALRVSPPRRPSARLRTASRSSNGCITTSALMPIGHGVGKGSSVHVVNSSIATTHPHQISASVWARELWDLKTL